MSEDTENGQPPSGESLPKDGTQTSTDALAEAMAETSTAAVAGAQSDDADSAEGSEEKDPQEDGKDASSEEDPADPSTWKLDLPEGFELSDGQREKVNEFAKETGADKKVLEAGAVLFREVYDQELQDHHASTKSAWQQEVINDKVLGGRNYQETQRQARQVLAEHGTPEATKFFEATGMMDNPHLLRILKSVHSATSDDGGIKSARTATPAPSIGDLWFPNSN